MPELHLAATGLALAYDLGSVDRLHSRRLEFLSSQPALGL